MEISDMPAAWERWWADFARLAQGFSEPLAMGGALAYRWRRHPWGGRIEPVTHPAFPALDDLIGIAAQQRELLANTRAFLAGRPANDALLSGARGTGKSSLVRAIAGACAGEGLRLLEVAARDLVDLADVVEPLWRRPERFIVYADDLGFDAGDAAFRALKAVLDGGVAARPANVLVYATSNRRRLLPEFFADNAGTRVVEGEIHPAETVEERISLADRFGLWLTFPPRNQAEYLELVRHWLARLGGAADDAAAAAALAWSRERASTSGRTALQFARDWLSRGAY